MRINKYMYVQTYDMILLITCNRHFVGIEGQKHHWRQGKKGGEARVRSSPKLSFSLLLFTSREETLMRENFNIPK